MTGTPLCFVHGLACTPDDWDGLRQTLDASRESLAVDLGFLAEDASSAVPNSLAGLAQKVLRRLAEPAVLIGHSLGCRLVLEATRQDRSNIAGLILVDGNRLTGSDPQAIRLRVGGDPDGFVDGFFGDMMGPRMPPAQGAALIARAKRMPASLMADLLVDTVGWDQASAQEALRITAPLPLLTIQSTTFEEGERRMTQPREMDSWSRVVKAARADAEIQVLGNTGHFSMLEDPEVVSTLIADFLRKRGL